MQRVEVIMGGAWSEEAAGLLRRAWAPPVIEYNGVGMEWQMGFPGGARMAGVWEEGRLIAMGAETPRRMKCGSREVRVRVVSFIAVDPERRGQGLAQTVYRALLEEMETPVLTFALKGSAGAGLIESVYPKLGFTLHRLAPCFVYGQLPRNAGDDWEVKEISASEWEGCAEEGVLMAAPGEEECRHWESDPREKRFLRMRQRESGELAWAWVTLSRVVQANGEMSETPSLECVAARHGAVGALRAASHWASVWHGQGGVVRAANLSCWEKEELRLQGWRQMSAPFESWLALRTGEAPVTAVCSLGAVT